MTQSVNSSREPVRATSLSIEEHAAPCHQHQRDEGGDLGEGDSERHPHVSLAPWATSSDVLPRSAAIGGNSTSISTITRSSTTSQPTAIRPLTDSTAPRSSRARRRTTVLATERARPNTRAAPKAPAPEQRRRYAKRGRCGDLNDSARNRDTTDPHQVAERKMQPYAKHQQHHADLGKLAGQVDIGDEARRGGTNHDAGDEVADQGRHLQTEATNPITMRQPQRGRDRRYQADAVGHVGNSVGLTAWAQELIMNEGAGDQDAEAGDAYPLTVA